MENLTLMQEAEWNHKFRQLQYQVFIFVCSDFFVIVLLFLVMVSWIATILYHEKFELSA